MAALEAEPSRYWDHLQREDLLPQLTTNSITSVLPPPPPRYTIPVAYAAGAANGMAVPVIETNNTISHPEGGCPLQVGEGTFSHTDDWASQPKPSPFTADLEPHC